MFNLFKPEPLNGSTYMHYKDMVKQNHLLVAGTTGSGKSTLVDALLYTLMFRSPATCQFIMIDLKKVALIEYRRAPHTIAYADTAETALDALRQAMTICEKRFEKMQKRHEKEYTHGDVYVIIDEWAEVATSKVKRPAMELVQRICQIGRAAHVHVILCTQCPLATIIPTAIKVNIDSRVGLRTRSARDSRNILDMTGCERLPAYGQGYYMNAQGVTLYNLPMIPEEDIERNITYWIKRRVKPGRVVA